MTRIAIVGMGCQYPEADSPTVLWRNVLAGRRSFREIPAERLDLNDYYSADRSAPDLTYNRFAAVLNDYHFDRLKFNVPGPAYRSFDIAHWLALDVAKRALDDAGFDDLPVDRRRVSVLIGNTLTGDHTRSGTLRLRWPYVRRAVASVMDAHGLSHHVGKVLTDLERIYKEPFAPIGEESLAGGLSNTISGRICNYFDFGGGGYTIDGACSSSLLTVIQAAIGLQRGDVDFALAGGVDVSIDPFELVGFAKTNALAETMMRVYDERSEGFWPGEGCGIVALAREEDARSWGLPIYAVLAGFGVSSDGHGGITRPEADGHVLAMQRAYERAGYGPDTVRLFEGHGTGTRVGDAAEVGAISSIRRLAGASDVAAIGSIKANIGHTKAAAGVAGLIKAVMSVHTGVIPPTTGCDQPLTELTGPDRVLEIRRTAAHWPDSGARRASVSAVGFGGINTHVTIEQPEATIRNRLWAVDSAVASTAQSAELIPLAAATLSDLAAECRRIASAARDLSFGRMSDLAINAARDLLPGQRARAAVIARTPIELADRCAQIAARIAAGSRQHIGSHYSFSAATQPPRIGYLFSGQGAPVRFTAGALGRRFPAARDILRSAALSQEDPTDTATAQPAIVAASAAALAVLDEIGLEATVAVGHSLGELTALHWAGVFSRDDLIHLAKVRGRAMSDCDTERGAMVELSTDEDAANQLIGDLPLSIAAINAADRTVVSGPEVSIQNLVHRAATRGVRATPLKVSHAFHSPLVADSARAIKEWFGGAGANRTVHRPVVSTVTGRLLSGSIDVERLLVDQITAPVLFLAALEAAAAQCDLLVEVGPGRILAGLAAGSGVPGLAVDVGAEDIAPLLSVVGAAFTLGAPVNLEALVRNRVSFDADPLRRPTYLANPCELIDKKPIGPVTPVDAHAEPPAHAASDAVVPAPADDHTAAATAATATDATAAATVTTEAVESDVDILDVVRNLIAAKTELPVSAIQESSTFLVDLKLNSIAVAQIATEAAKSIRRQPLRTPHELAEGSVGELVEMLRQSPSADEHSVPEHTAGVDDWVHPFTVRWVPRRRGGSRRTVSWTLLDGCGDELRAIFSDERGSTEAPRGVVLALDEIRTEADARRAIERVARVAGDRSLSRVVISHAGGASSLARTLYMERPDLTVRLLDAADVRAAVSDEQRRHVRRECETGDGFEALRFDESGQVLVPRLFETPLRASDESYLGIEDTILVSGGGKGIGAEAALSIGKRFGAKIAVIGRSAPDSDKELQANLARMKEHGIRVQYEQADVTNAASVRAAVHRLESALGPITGILHSAGVNVPGLLANLTAEAISSTWRSKVGGLENMIDAVDPARLRLLVAFGSFIGRTGMRGEAHYAVANERLRAVVEGFATEHPSCRCLAIEWSVWSGVGMGAKLGLLDALNNLGVRPISPEAGIDVLHALMTSDSEVAPIVCGRFGLAAKTLPTREADLPFLRFIEKPLVHYPGIELVAEAVISGEKDRYLSDHVLDGALLFPAVAGIEAMAQVAQSLTGGRAVSRIVNLRLRRPITVPVDGTRRLQIAGLVRAGNVVDVCIRSDETNFNSTHFTATYVFDEEAAEPVGQTDDRPELLPNSAEIVHTLYRELLFHGPNFQRVRGFRRVESARCRADVDATASARWFVDYLPQDLVLGDLAARDASLHAAQACIPHHRVLPMQAEEIRFFRRPQGALIDVDSIERVREQRSLTFDTTLRDETGAVVETWTGLRLQAVDDLASSQSWPPELLAAYLERSLDLRWGPGTGCRITIVDTGGFERGRRSEIAVRHATNDAERLLHRPDGRPELASGRQVSLSHHDRYTLVLISDHEVGVDLEAVTSRPAETWRGMLGSSLFGVVESLSHSSGEDIDTCATRVWSAMECLRKLGVAGDPALDIGDPPDGDWVTLTHGTVQIITVTVRIFGIDGAVIVAAGRRTTTDASIR